jgi:hypothetical protein
MICEMAVKWAKPTRQPRGVTLIRRNHSRKVETIALKSSGKVEIPNIEVREHQDSSI